MFAEDYRIHPKIAEGEDERTERGFYYININTLASFTHSLTNLSNYPNSMALGTRQKQKFRRLENLYTCSYRCVTNRKKNCLAMYANKI